MTDLINEPRSDDQSQPQELMPWWTPLFMATLCGGCAIAVVHPQWDDPRGWWIIGATAALVFVANGLFCLGERLATRPDPDHSGGIQALFYRAFVRLFRSRSDDQGQDLVPWWLPFLMAAVFEWVGFAALYREWDDVVARWFVGALALAGFVGTGLFCLFDRIKVRLSHFAGIQVLDHDAGIQALVFGGWTVVFAVGLSVEEDIWLASFGKIAGVIGLTLWLGALSIAGFGAWLGCRWGERLNETLLGLTSFAVLALFAWFAMQTGLQLWAGGQPPSIWEVLLSELVILWSVIGLLACVTSKTGSRLSSVSSVLLLPLVLLVTAPIPAGIAILAIVLFSGAGELLGRELGYPLIGAFVGLVFLVTVLVITSKYKKEPEA